VFYTALGHEQAVWRDARYQQLLLNAFVGASMIASGEQGLSTSAVFRGNERSFSSISAAR
jgi:type 1 glutamine amidotransferase